VSILRDSLKFMEYMSILSDSYKNYIYMIILMWTQSKVHQDEFTQSQMMDLAKLISVQLLF